VLHSTVEEVFARFGRAERLTITKALYDKGAPRDLIEYVVERISEGVIFLTVESVWDYRGTMAGAGDR
jgi:hypothetical protein